MDLLYELRFSIETNFTESTPALGEVLRSAANSPFLPSRVRMVDRVRFAANRLHCPPAPVTETGEIRANSLKIFDHSFAVTHLLEAVAIVIGLFSVADKFSAQTLARAKEFGMLRHIGATRRQILVVLAAEGGLLTATGILVGFPLD